MAFVSEVIQFIAGVRAVVAGTPRTAASVNAGLSDLASRTKWLNERLYQLLLGAPLTISAVNTTTDRLTVTGHGIPANTAVQVFATNGGTLPGGLAVGTVYYVDVIDADTIKLSATSGPGAAVDLTAGFVGDCYAQIIPDWLSTLLIADATYGAGKLTSLVMFLAGTQTVSGAKTFVDITVSGTNKYKQASRVLTRTLPATWVNETDGTCGLFANGAKLAGGTADDWHAGLDLPHGQVISEISVRLDPTNVGGLPGTMPTIAFHKTHRTTLVDTTIASGTDSSASTGAYNAAHDLTATGFSETIDTSTYNYWLIVRGSSGSSPANDIIMVGPSATITCASLGHWS
jgi:hypothetical protein